MTDTGMIVGFIPLVDCAPLVVAVEKGFAAQEGIDLTLVRETSWANIRDRLIVGQFDAAHMLGPMAVASTLGIGHLKVPMIAPYSLGLGGNAVTVSNSVWEQMTLYGAFAGAEPSVQGEALRCVVRAREQLRKPPLTFAMVYPFSCHNYELRYWLAACGIHPDRDVRLVVIPPPLLVDAMREGQIDGFCAGAPWNSLAVTVGVGSIATVTSAIWRFSPEKILGLRLEWAQRHPERLSALLRGLYRASAWCEEQEHHEELARLLAQPKYVGAPAELVQHTLDNRLRLMPAEEPQPVDNYYIPAACHATFPWTSHALWYYTQMVRWRQVEYAAEHLPAVRATYRPDLYRLALAPLKVTLPTHDTKIEGGVLSSNLKARPAMAEPDGFFDGRVFDPADLPGYLAGLNT